MGCNADSGECLRKLVRSVVKEIIFKQMQIQVPQDTTFLWANERKSNSLAVFFGMAEAQNHANASPQWRTATMAVNPPSAFLVRDGIYFL